MTRFASVVEALIGVVGEERVREDVSLARMTTLRVGGAAAVVVSPETEAGLAGALEVVTRAGLAYAVVGLGSNLIAPDAGFEGVVFRLRGALSEVRFPEERGERIEVEVGGGAVNAHVVRKLHAEGYVGAEFLALVPGTIGGAVAMNAGTKWGELSEILREVRVVTPGGERRWLGVDALSMAYRHAELPEGALVAAARIEVERGDVEAASDAVRKEKAYREKTQPYKLATHGSVFRNPVGDAAGRLIDVCGLKGAREGGAVVSEKHANWIVNEGGARAMDVLRLMSRVRAEVRRQTGVVLEPEVRLLGFERDVVGQLDALEEEP